MPESPYEVTTLLRAWRQGDPGALERLVPLVYGELMQTGASSTYVFYGHYDGQPVDPKEWATPPFEPTLRDQRLDKGGKILSLPAPGQSLNSEWRLYARAAADDKAPIMAMMAALDALRSAGIQPKANLKLVFDGEEEIGSPNLARLLTAHRDLLQADLWIICDGPERLSRRQTVVVGHSVGGIILVKVLTEHPWAREFGAIFLLAAPFAGDGGWSSDNLQFPPDLGARFPKGVPIHFYHGLEDEVVPPSHVDLYARAVPQARVHRLRGRDHQLNNDLREVARAIVSLEAGR